jgi:hypothetical protein
LNLNAKYPHSLKVRRDLYLGVRSNLISEKIDFFFELFFLNRFNMLMSKMNFSVCLERWCNHYFMNF